MLSQPNPTVTMGLAVLATLLTGADGHRSEYVPAAVAYVKNVDAANLSLYDFVAMHDAHVR